MNHPTLRQFLACCLGLPGTFAMAATPDPDSGDERLATVVVESKRLEGADSAEKRLDNVPGATSVIRNADVEQGRAASMQDVLSGQPGVFVTSAGGNDAVHVSIRGSGMLSPIGNMPNGVKYLMDGVPLTGPAGASYELFEPLNLDYTEVLRGANAFEQGALTLGGAINFVGKSGRSAPGTRLHYEGGSFGYQKSQFAHGGVIGDSDYYLTLVDSRRDGFQDHTFRKSRVLHSNFGHVFSPDLQTRLQIRYGEEFHQTPGLLSKSQLQDNPRRTSSSVLANRSQVDKYASFQIGSTTRYRLDDASEVQLGLGYYKLPQRSNAHSTTPGAGDYADFSTTLRYSRHDELFGLANELELGWFLTRQNVGKTYAYLSNGNGKVTRKQNSYNGSLDNVFSIGDTLSLSDSLRLLVGLSAAQIKRDIAIDYSAAPNNSQYPSALDYDEWKLAPRLGLTWQASPELQLFANASRSLDPAVTWQYSPSTYSTAVNFVKPLVVQNANTVELGLRFSNERIDASAAIYRSWVKDELLIVEVEPATQTSSAITTAFNASPTIHQGVELGLSTALWQSAGRRLDLRQAYTFNDFYFRGDEQFGTNQLPGIPRHLYQASLKYQDGGFHAGLSATGVSGYYIDFANTLEAAPYWLFGANLGYDYKDQWSVFLSLNNLTDKKYASAVNVTYDAAGNHNLEAFYPGDGRSLTAGVSYHF
ncbi:TonB-dependent receptor family protein [Pseudomonas sp. LRF_L74]|uniref:TonB-dependent receptor family protein n=1 Tax=Pseudomonas sp. LRF_L74 TaxID=3369422 RepID=UPI003F6155E7